VARTNERRAGSGASAGQHRQSDGAGDNGRVLRALALAAVATGLTGLAVGACLISYQSVHALATLANVDDSLAKVYPIIGDASLAVAGCSVLALRGAGLVSRLYAWLCFFLVLAALAASDVVHAAAISVPKRAAEITAAVLPWVLVLLAFCLLLALLRHAKRRRPSHRAGEAGTARVAPLAAIGPASARPAVVEPAVVEPAVVEPAVVEPAPPIQAVEPDSPALSAAALAGGALASGAPGTGPHQVPPRISWPDLGSGFADETRSDLHPEPAAPSKPVPPGGVTEPDGLTEPTAQSEPRGVTEPGGAPAPPDSPGKLVARPVEMLLRARRQPQPNLGHSEAGDAPFLADPPRASHAGPPLMPQPGVAPTSGLPASGYGGDTVPRGLASPPPATGQPSGPSPANAGPADTGPSQDDTSQSDTSTTDAGTTDTGNQSDSPKAPPALDRPRSSPIPPTA
jgi:hypothetical protein